MKVYGNACVGTGPEPVTVIPEPRNPMTTALAEHVAAHADPEPAAVVYPNPIDDPDEIVPIWLCELGQHDECDGYACPCCASGQRPHTGKAAQPEHVHDVYPAWEPDGTAYALCTGCPTRWDRQPCDHDGCKHLVSTLVIAQTGRARHKHHAEAS